MLLKKMSKTGFFEYPAFEIITLATMAIEMEMTAAAWKKIVFPHPTVSEIFRETL